MSVYKQHLDLASERFGVAERLFEEEKDFHTAAHLHINTAINYNNAVCQKFLRKIPSHKVHSGTSYFNDLSRHSASDRAKYEDSYKYLVGHKNEADYGTELSLNTAKQIMRRARTFREIAERLL